jgi:protein-L-isoaspartate(D-aspartate) O-methyltransferase
MDIKDTVGKERFYAVEREEMVDTQLMPRGIEDEAVLDSMLTVPRHKFVPDRLEDRAYEDCALPIAEGQTISQPYIVALMVEALKPNSTDKILEIGTGSGYAAAVLSRTVYKVYTIERHEKLAEKAKDRFEELDYNNIEVRIGDGTKGWPEEEKFDGIVVSAGAPVVPESLAEQLVVGGNIVIPVGRKEGGQDLLRLTKKKDNNLAREYLGEVRFVPLIGEEGWEGKDDG